ncbi:uncharacterized protein J3R85_017936 [Psidium guajava]|nr:uncharacterized protein J3R85_017936 [Psidium guajava]
MLGRGGDVHPVKVVIIDTQYFETDVASFKSVVQKLTGKDSTVTVSPKSADNLFHCSSEEGKQRAMPERSRFEPVWRTNSPLCRDELCNRSMSETRPVDELHQLWLWAQS